ncbi:MAG: hypothetical protein MUC63_10590, partial [Planctomycetes bacterium]|nr:hypothetical protein [Planctomycetota bacterium]
MSRFLPAVLAARSMKALGIRDPALEGSLPDMVAAGLFRLCDFQHADGGWGWWAHDASTPWMTAYVTAGLCEARKAGFFVDEGVLRRAAAFLDRECRSDGKADPQPRAFARHALALTGAAELPGAAELAADPSASTPFTLAFLALAFDAAGQTDRARACAAALAAKAQPLGSSARLEDPWRHWAAGPVPLHAAALRAVLRVLPGDPLAQKLLLTVLAARRGSSWGTTLGTAQAVAALSEFLGRDRPPGARADFRILRDGREILRSDGGPGPWAVDSAWDPAGAGAPPKLALASAAGSDVLYVSAEFESWTGDLPVEMEGDLVVQKTVHRLFAEGGGETSLGPALDRTAELRVGDMVRVRFEVHHRGTKTVDQLVLEDPRVSCLEFMTEDDRGGRYLESGVRAEFRDGAAVFFLDDLPLTGWSVEYDARVERAGAYRVLPAEAHAMYTPDVRGHSDDGCWIVRDREAPTAAPEMDARQAFARLRELVADPGQPDGTGELRDRFVFLCRSDHEPFWEWLASEDFRTVGGMDKTPSAAWIRGLVRRLRIETRSGLKAFFLHPAFDAWLGAWESVPDLADRLVAEGVPGPGPDAAERLADVVIGLPPESRGARAAAAVFARLPLLYRFPHLPRMLEAFVASLRASPAAEASPLVVVLAERMEIASEASTAVTRIPSAGGAELRVLEIRGYDSLPVLRLDLGAWLRYRAALGSLLREAPRLEDPDARTRASAVVSVQADFALALLRALDPARTPGIGEFRKPLEECVEVCFATLQAWLEDPAARDAASSMLAAAGREGFWERFAASEASKDPAIL